MKESHFEQEIRELFEALESIKAGRIEADEKIDYVEKIKYLYFRKGYFACLTNLTNK